MDTNLKNNETSENIENEVEIKQSIHEEKEIKEKSPKSNGFIAILLLLILAVVSVGLYNPIKKSIGINESNSANKYLTSWQFASMIGEETDDILERENNDIDYWGLKYYVSQNGEYKYGNIDKENVQNVDSMLTIKLWFDENGNQHITSSPKINGFDENRIMSNLDCGHDDRRYFRNVGITYMVPNDIANYDNGISREIHRVFLNQYMMIVCIIGAIGMLLSAILALLLPYSRQKHMGLVRAFNGMYIEFKMIAYFIIGMGFVVLVSLLYEMNYMQNSPFNLVTMLTNANLPFYMIGIPASFVIYLMVYLLVVYVKHLFTEGFLKTLLNNSICVKMIKKVFEKSGYIAKDFEKSVTDFKGTDKAINKKIIKILSVNFIALCVIAAFWGFGIILAFMYSIFLFEYLSNVIKKVRILNDATDEIANGNFDVEIKGDMGVLSTATQNLNSIKDGFKVALKKEVQSEQMKTQLISNVSHDLKTPLTSIINYVDLLKDEKLDEQTKQKYIGILDTKSKRLNVLINDLFEVSKATSGDIEINKEDIDIVSLFRQTIGEMNEKVVSSDLKFKTSLPEDKVICSLDGKKTYRIFENILNNILKYSMKKTRVYIDAVENDDSVVFTFKNIANYEMNFDASEILERSVRGDVSRNTTGSGLGLAIAKSLANAQDVRLDVSIDGDLFKVEVVFLKK